MAALRYSTGRPCKRGHLSERWVKTGICIECAALLRKQFRADNPEKVAAYLKAQRGRMTEDQIASDRIRAQLWRDTNPEKARDAVRNYTQRNPDKKVAKEHKRRARKRGSVGQYTINDLADIVKMQRSKCACCRMPVTRKIWHVDHIMPLSLGGDNSRSNIQILCKSCNLSKGGRHPLDFARSLGGLL